MKRLILTLIASFIASNIYAVEAVIANNTKRDLRITEALPDASAHMLGLHSVIKAKSSIKLNVPSNFEMTLEDTSRKFHQFKVNNAINNVKIEIKDGYLRKNKIKAKNAKILTLNKGK